MQNFMSRQHCFQITSFIGGRKYNLGPVFGVFSFGVTPTANRGPGVSKEKVQTPFVMTDTLRAQFQYFWKHGNSTVFALHPMHTLFQTLDDFNTNQLC